MPTSPAARQPGATAVLGSSCVAMLAVGANGTAIMAALPTMRTELSLDPAGVQWAINAYLVVSAACIVIGGAAADRFGARRVAMFGLALFAIASSIIAIASDEPTLGTAKAAASPCSARPTSNTLTAVGISAPSDQRGAAIAAWSGFLMLGFSVGPLIGGALTHLAGWRLIFWLNVVLMLAAIGGLVLAGPAPPRPDRTQRRPADWLGFVLLATLHFSWRQHRRCRRRDRFCVGPDSSLFRRCSRWWASSA
ncbi:MAG: MFS transporter [Betaproteobacteria bacterium]|nr:MAG: MFS transporter [Betaproteobacteria bacterium]